MNLPLQLLEAPGGVLEEFVSDRILGHSTILRGYPWKSPTPVALTT